MPPSPWNNYDQEKRNITGDCYILSSLYSGTFFVQKGSKGQALPPTIAPFFQFVK